MKTIVIDRRRTTAAVSNQVMQAWWAGGNFNVVIKPKNMPQKTLFKRNIRQIIKSQNQQIIK